ncbi:MAG: tetratricopeptide repeat protein [Planctomycetota bacterium]|jgi:serine/threonine-protein kinase
MINIRWAKLNRVITFFLPGIIYLLCFGGCSQPASSGAKTHLVPDDSTIEYKVQADRPPTAKTLFAMADIFATQGRDSECELVLNRIIHEYPNFILAYNSLAELQMRHGRINKAIETITSGLRIRSEDPVLLNNLGMCRMIRRDYGKALDMFTKAAGIMPENARYRANMAVALALMGRYDESLSLFKQVLPEEQASQNVSVIRKVRKNAEQDSAAKPGALDLEEAKK